jgi:chemotaxis protein methyltransferase CheR
MKTEPSEIEIDLILETVKRMYGYDFTNYARSSLKRRLYKRVKEAGLELLSEMIPRLLYEDKFFDDLLLDLSVTVTEMFRDPILFRVIREKVIPVLKTYPFVKIWHAGCATGEEVYSMAIVLHEEGYYKRSQFYCTDFNKKSLQIAREGIYELVDLQEYGKNYFLGGGKKKLSEYYLAKYSSAVIDDFLKKNILFSHHNLVGDTVFGEMQMIICRNVIIYFDNTLKERVFRLFDNSLCNGGFLCLGPKETLDFSSIRDRYELIDKKEKIYQKI